jgi:hypothetical protein
MTQSLGSALHHISNATKKILMPTGVRILGTKQNRQTLKSGRLKIIYYLDPSPRWASLSRKTGTNCLK